MSDDASLDAQLRRMAAAATAQESGAVNVDEGVAGIQRRLQGSFADVAVVVDERRRRAPRMALGVAAAVLALVSVASILVIRGTGGGNAPVTDTPTLPPPVTTQPSAATTTAPVTTSPPPAAATAEPSEVRQGDAVAITPSATITRACADIVTVLRREGEGASMGQIAFGQWLPAEATTSTTMPDCAGTTSAETVSLVIPATMPVGSYDLCLADPGFTEGCARVAVLPPAEPPDCIGAPTAPPSLVDGTPPGEVTVADDVARWSGEDSANNVRQVLRPADASWIEDALAAGRAITRDTFQAAVVPAGDPPISDITIYLRDGSVGCVLTYNVGPGLYTVDVEALARRWVDALAEAGVAAPIEPAIGIEYYGRRTVLQEPYFAIDRIAADGSIDQTLTQEELAALSPTDALPDGSTLTLAGERVDGRCVNRPVVSSSGAADVVAALVAEARSLFVTEGGVAIIGRDVCDGARWGEPGTRWELLAVDTSLGLSAAPIVLVTRASDPGEIAYEDGNVIVAFGEMSAVGASPNGRYISVVDIYNSEQWRWHLLDLQQPGAAVDVASSCPIAGDIVGPPRFVEEGTVVVARQCATSRTGDLPAAFPLGDGDLRIEAVDLRGSTEGGELTWSAAPSGLEPNSYTHTAGLDAVVGPDGQIWAIVTGNGGVEEPSESYLLRGTETIDITRPGFDSFAFDLVRFADVAVPIGA
jgi:hypothetical protein